MRTGLDDATIPSEVVRYPLWLRSTATPISFIILTAAMPALRHDVEVNRLDSPVKAAEKNGNSLGVSYSYLPLATALPVVMFQSFS
jgi:hypothetical protein